MIIINNNSEVLLGTIIHRPDAPQIHDDVDNDDDDDHGDDYDGVPSNMYLPTFPSYIVTM